MANQKTFVDLDNGRLEEQKREMEKISDRGHCPFCLENLRLYHKDPILKETEFWLLTPNQWPYENTKIHLMAIYKEHAEVLSDLKPGAGEDLLQLFAWAEKEYHVPGGAFAMRFGDTSYSAGTVIHLHAQFIMPNIEKADFLPVRFKIGKDPKDKK
jgi:ATP adenylyltransferase